MPPASGSRARPVVDSIERVLRAKGLGPLRSWVSTNSAKGLSWRALAVELSDLVEIPVSDKTLRLHFATDPDVVRARAIAAQNREMASGSRPRPAVDPVEQELDHLGLGPLRSWVATNAAKGMHWRDLAGALAKVTGISVSHETLRLHFATDPDVVRARAIAAQNREMARAIPHDREGVDRA